MGGRHAATIPAGDAELLDVVLGETGREIASAELRSLDAASRGELRGYTVVTRDPAGAEETHHLYVEPAAPGDPPPGVLRVRGDDGSERDVWSYPRDPALPALAAAAHPEGARVLLARLGIDVGPSPGVHAVSYRAHRRAAVRVSGGGHLVYLKVVPPGAARAIFDRHVRWAEHGIAVPAALAWSPEGLVALAPLPGRPASDALPELARRADAVEALDELRARIARVPEPEPARRSLAARAGWYRDRLATRRPELAAQLDPLAARIAAGIAERPAPRATIHGDLHLAQVFLQPGTESLAVLDLDTGGLGDPADDDGGLWAHLVSAAFRADARGDGEARDAAVALAPLLHPRRHGDAGRVERALAVAATHLLGHALTGAVPEAAAIGLAESVLDRPDESPLIPVSGPSHARPGS